MNGIEIYEALKNTSHFTDEQANEIAAMIASIEHCATKAELEDRTVSLQKLIEELRIEMRERFIKNRERLADFQVETQKNFERYRIETQKSLERHRVETQKSLEQHRVETQKSISELKESIGELKESNSELKVSIAANTAGLEKKITNLVRYMATFIGIAVAVISLVMML